MVYRFEDTAARTAWLQSEERRTLIEEGAELVVGQPTEQVLAVDSSTGQPVTAVASVKIRPGQGAAYQLLHDQLLKRLERFDGYLSCDLYEAVSGVQEETVTVFAFETRPALDRWLASAERAAIIDQMNELVEGGRTINVVGGFAGWFPAPGGTSVKIWKQSAVVLLALFPTVLALTLLRERFLPDLGLVAGVFVGNVIGVAMLGWVLMPWLTRVFEPWLQR